MNKHILTNLIKNVRATTVKHSPAILTGIGIAGMITTTVLAVKATPKALVLIDEAENEKNADLTPVETVKTTWKCYVPAAVTGAASITCLIGANSVNAKRTAALAAAYQISETALTEYREKVVETIGEKKEQTIRDKVAKERIDRNPVSKNEVIVTSKGNTLFYEPISGRYFKSDIEKVKKAENDLNKQMLHDICGYVSLNDFYDEIGLPRTTMGDELGWNTDILIDINFSAQLTEDDEPCIALDYRSTPKYHFSKFM